MKRVLLALWLCAVAVIALAACGSAETEKNGGIVILYTSDIHCGVDQGFGLAGLKQVRDTLEKQGYATLLVDNGDALQGEALGMVTKGEAMIDLMNAAGYDIAVPGNHDFDYGVDRLVELTERADFEYICCNLEKNGERMFPAYTVREVAGKRIAFVGITTPDTLITSTPKLFQDADGNFIYDFQQDPTGAKLFAAVQAAVDAARAEGVDYVYALAHLGIRASRNPYTYADVLANTSGIDVMLDGHSHDTEQVVMKNRDGKDVARSACGTKMQCIGYSIISADGSVRTDIWSWPNADAAPALLDIENPVRDAVAAVLGQVDAQTGVPVAKANVELTTSDPKAVDESGNPVRMIRRAETNLGDFIADALRVQTGADICLCGGGGMRADIDRGDISYNTILSVFPFQNQVVMIRATGQQVLDALEWGAARIPGEFGGFLQVSGLGYEIDPSVPSGCKGDENGMMTGIEGARRVRNVTVGGQPIDPEKAYTVAGLDYTLLNNGDGHTAFDGAEVVLDQFKLDSQALMDYILDDLGGVIGAEYADPYGQGRIAFAGE